MDSIFPSSQFGRYDSIYKASSSEKSSKNDSEYNQEIEWLLKQYTENDIQDAIKAKEKFEKKQQKKEQ